MPQRPSRSLKYEYELYVEREIENYKESVPRSVLLSIGDEAVRVLADEQQFALTELLLWDEVDRIIFKRLRLPSYATWRKRRVKLLSELKRPEHWGLSPDDVVVRAVQPMTGDAKVLVAGTPDENRSLLYLAAHGCDLIHVEAGQTMHDDRPEYRRGFLTALSDRVRNEARVPTIVGGYLTTLDEANTIVGAGRADLVLLELPQTEIERPTHSSNTVLLGEVRA